MDELDESTRKVIFESTFEHKKCGEILLSITKLFIENKCNSLERQYIIITLQSLDITSNIITILKDNDL